MRTTMLFCLLSIASLATPATDKFQPLNVKTGLWEVTQSVTTSGQMPLPADALARLTPEQRARLEERMKAMAAQEKPHTTIHKNCITREKLNEDPFSSEEEKGCTHKLLSSTSSKADIQVNCARGNVKTSAMIHVLALDTETIKGSGHITATDGGHTMNSESTFSGKWIGESCGKTR